MSKKTSSHSLAAALSVGLLALAAQPAVAQETEKVLRLELNAVQPSDKGCRLTFLIANELGVEVTRAAFEIALFDKAGVVDRLTVLDFADLPVGKTKVVRFDLTGTDCAGISRVLVNHATECAGDGLDPKACMRQLKPESKGSVPFGV